MEELIHISLRQTLQFAEGEQPLEVDFQLEKGSFTTLYGPSGAGKTTILRILAGLMIPEQGKIIVQGVPWLETDRRVNVKPQHRSVGLVFQEYALFPNMTVRENLEFALEKGHPASRIEELIDTVELRELQDRKPASLSGGQQQRVALARALVRKPQLLLLDEPLSALDRGMRLKLQEYLLHAHQSYGLTTLLVSHDVSESLKLSDRVLMIEKGRIVKDGPPAAVFAQKEMGGKFQFTGEIIAMEKQDFLYILSILIGKEVVRVVADREEVASFSIGEEVLVASKAFNPVIRKLG